MEKFRIEKVSNMIMIIDECGQVWRAWDETEFTERKLKNAVNRIKRNYQKEVEFINAF